MSNLVRNKVKKHNLRIFNMFNKHLEFIQNNAGKKALFNFQMNHNISKKVILRQYCCQNIGMKIPQESNQSQLS